MRNNLKQSATVMAVFFGSAAVAVLLSLNGCAALTGQTAQQSVTYTINVGVLASQIDTVDPQIAQAERTIESDKSAFTTAEWQQLKASQNSINQARDTVSAIVSGANGAQTVVSLSQLQMIYANAKSGYQLAKPIIKKHESSLTPSQQQQLKKLDQSVTQLNKDYKRVLTSKIKGADVTKMLSNALTVAGLAAKVAIMAGA